MSDAYHEILEDEDMNTFEISKRDSLNESQNDEPDALKR